MNTMQLISLPVNKTYRNHFTLGKHYEILGELGNAFIIMSDRGVESLVLKERFANGT